MSPKDYEVSVNTPGSILKFSIKRGSTGRHLFNQVCTTIGLREIWYFGLQFTDSKGRKKWVKLNKKISPNSKSKDSPLDFVFKVKFYPEEVTEDLIQGVTQELFYSQIKSQIISGEVYASADSALLLASYQALINREKHDRNATTPINFDIRNYIAEHIRSQYTLTDAEWKAKIDKWHEQHGDMPKAEAIIEYLKVAQELEMYGVTYFSIKNSKKTPLYLGVDALGLNIYDAEDRLVPKISFPWNEIRNVSFFRNKFTVKSPGLQGQDLVFSCDSMSTCKDLLALCSGNHELYARRRLPDTIEVQQMKAQAKETKTAREMERQKLLAEQRARELVQNRLDQVLQAMQDQELAYEMTQHSLSEHQLKVKELEEQLEEEKSSRQRLQEMQQYLEEVNQRLELESAASSDDRLKLAAERDAVREQIESQQKLIEQQEEEKKRIKAELENVRDHSRNGSETEFGEKELQLLDGLSKPEVERQAMTAVDLDHAKRLQMMRNDLESARDRRKLQQVDIRYEENLTQGMDKFRTLHAIRQGNTKKRVEQFESM